MNDLQRRRQIENIIVRYLRSRGAYIEEGCIEIGNITIALDRLAYEIAEELQQ